MIADKSTADVLTELRSLVRSLKCLVIRRDAPAGKIRDD